MGNEDNISTRLTYLLIGGGIGAVLALLFAPKSGQELRGDIADATRKGIDRSREAAQQLGERAGEYYETTRDRAAELYSQRKLATLRIPLEKPHPRKRLQWQLPSKRVRKLTRTKNERLNCQDASKLRQTTATIRIELMLPPGYQV